MDDLNLELSSDDDDNNQPSPSSCSESDDIGSSEFEESDESDKSDVEASAGPPPPITSSSGANIVKENNNNKSKSNLQHNGENLFPPGGSKGSRASKAWDFGGLKKDSKGRVLTDKMFCGLCSKEFKYNQSPGALNDHLNNHHMQVLIEEMEEKKNNQTKLTDFRFEKTKVEEKYKANNPKQKAFRGDMRDWIIENKRPFNIANDAGLRKIIKGLDPRIKVPCGQTFMNDVSKEYVNKRKIQKERFKEVEYFKFYLHK